MASKKEEKKYNVSNIDNLSSTHQIVAKKIIFILWFWSEGWRLSLGDT